MVVEVGDEEGRVGEAVGRGRGGQQPVGGKLTQGLR